VRTFLGSSLVTGFALFSIGWSATPVLICTGEIKSNDSQGVTLLEAQLLPANQTSGAKFEFLVTDMLANRELYRSPVNPVHSATTLTINEGTVPRLRGTLSPTHANGIFTADLLIPEYTGIMYCKEVEEEP
jgi:hypothetical protein